MRSRRILVIDDEEHIREVTQMSLETIGGWDVTSAASGAEGFATAAAEQPDAVILDVMMPGMDGPSTFARLRVDPDTRAIPVVMLMAKVQASDRRRFADIGVDGVLTKPFDPMTLADEVAEVLGWSPPA